MIATLLLSALLTQATTYRINPAACEAGFDLKATMHTVHGSTRSLTGEIRVEPEAAGALKLSGRIEIGAASLKTANEKRDATMHSESLLVASYPTIVFEPQRFTPSGPALPNGSIPGALVGRLTIRGQTKDQAMSATLAPQGERVVASGTFDVAWGDFGVPDPSFSIFRIKPVAQARFRAEFVPLP